MGVMLQQMPNLVLEPGTEDVRFEALVAATNAQVQTDCQGRTGWGMGTLWEITNGKLGASIKGLAFTFSTMNLWKSVMALGDACDRHGGLAGVVPRRAAALSRGRRRSGS